MAKQPPDKILIVDDEPDIALTLKLHLEDAGYLTSWAADGEAGLNLLHSDCYSLVLLDVRMPLISGVEVLHRLRADNFDTAVIMMTAHGNENLVAECMKAGAADYVSKPFDIDDLLHRMERAIDNRRTLKEKTLLEQEKEEFVFMLSHDMKNPITAVIGSIDIMREGRLGPINPEQADYLQSAIESCEEVVTMIDNLLDMQRFNTGRMPTRISPTNPYTLLAEAVRRFSPAAEREHITLTLEASPNVPEIAVDSTVMGRVIANLLGNALKFTPEEGSITISCRCIEYSERHHIRIPVYAAIPVGLSERRCFVRISVRDNGSGIPPGEMTRIFERYVQAGNASMRSRGGAGLGLAFCKKAVESFNGCIWVESEEGEGSIFIILLPCHPNDYSCNKSIPEKSS
jgi:two-component system, sensor histidine kinase and response regulator